VGLWSLVFGLWLDRENTKLIFGYDFFALSAPPLHPSRLKKLE